MIWPCIKIVYDVNSNIITPRLGVYTTKIVFTWERNDPKNPCMKKIVNLIIIIAVGK